MVSSAEISRGLLARILGHAALRPDREACGLLFGTAARIADAVPAENVSAHPTDSFEIDPAVLFAAMRAERAGGRAMIGHYHSHPGGRPIPSPRDAAAAHDPGRLWLIVAGGEARLWRARPGGAVEGMFDAVELRATG